MSAKFGKLLSSRSALTALVIGFGLCLPVTEASIAQANGGTDTEQPTDGGTATPTPRPAPSDGSATTPPATNENVAIPECENDPTEDWLIGNTADPTPEDERAILKLIHRYNWALDDKDPVQLSDLFGDDVFFELCSPSNEQYLKNSGRQNVEKYLTDHFNDLDTHVSRTRHIESNTVLNSVDANNVQGKTTVVVTLQHGNIETPVLDYTAALRTEFKKYNGAWKFWKLTLITDEPKIKLRAR